MPQSHEAQIHPYQTKNGSTNPCRIWQGTTLFFVALSVLLAGALVWQGRELNIRDLPSQAAAELWTEKGTFQPGETIRVFFGALPGHAGDWLTIVPPDAPPNDYQEWHYTGGQRNGEQEFKQPLEPGPYEVRLYYDWPSGGFQIQQRRGFVVEDAVPGAKENPGIRYDLLVRPTFDDQPVEWPADRKPSFTVVESESNQVISPRFAIKDDGFLLQDLPQGHLKITSYLRMGDRNFGPAGDDYVSWGGVEVDLNDEGRQVILPMQQIIHLLDPQDNGERMNYAGSSDCEPIATYTGPVTFRWKPLGEGIRYLYSVGKVDCIEHLYTEGSVVQGETQNNQIRLELPPTPPNEKYFLHLKAYRGDSLLGRLYLYDKGGSNWNYGFRIQ